MIIVGGRILGATRGTGGVPRSVPMVQALRAPGCWDFVVAADPLESGRINVHEESDSEAALEAFRGDGPDPI